MTMILNRPSVSMSMHVAAYMYFIAASNAEYYTPAFQYCIQEMQGQHNYLREQDLTWLVWWVVNHVLIRSKICGSPQTSQVYATL